MLYTLGNGTAGAMIHVRYTPFEALEPLYDCLLVHRIPIPEKHTAAGKRVPKL
jgi:hypothetical protein